MQHSGAWLWFYRHSDGYPESVLPDLEPLMERLREGSLRDNVSQFSGWLIVKGNKTYGPRTAGYDEWKVGHYEPTTGLHQDVEYVYEIDLRSKELTVERGALTTFVYAAPLSGAALLLRGRRPAYCRKPPAFGG